MDDVTLPNGGNRTLGGTAYRNIQLGRDAIVTFTAPLVQVSNITTAEGAKIGVAPCTRIHIAGNLTLGRQNAFNKDNNEVWLYVGRNFSAGRGTTSKVSRLYALGNITVEAGSRSAVNYMAGGYIGDIVTSGDFTTWNVRCGASFCLPGVNQREAALVSREERVLVLPNPADQTVTLKTEGWQSGAIEVDIHDATGRQMQKLVVPRGLRNDAWVIPTGMLPNGLYFIGATDARGARVVRKLLIMHGK
jgi:hypothetical protein